jgi:sugar diacid utilization regulator
MDSVVMQQTELLNETQIRNLLNISNFVNSNLDLNSILQNVVDAITDNTIWPIAGIVYVNEEKQEVWFAAQRGFHLERPLHEDRWTLDISLSPQAINSKKTIVIEDILKLKNFPEVRDYAIKCGYRSVLVVPLLNVKPSTALWLCTEQVSKFTKNDIIFAECLANQVAIAFRNATLYEQSRSQSAELQKINYTLGKLLNMVIDRNKPEEIRDAAAQLVENPIWFEDVLGNRLPDGSGPPLPQSTIEEELPIRYPFGDKNVLAMPVLSGNEQFGWLLTWDSVRSFQDSDIGFVRQLALVFSLIFLKELVHHEVESQIRTDLFSSLVSETEPDSKSDNILKQRARALRVELPQPARVGILDFQAGTSPLDLNHQYKLARAAKTVAKWIPHRLVALQEQYIALLISPGEEEIVSNRLTELNYFFPNAHPLFALGDQVHQTSQFGESLHSAFKVLQAAQYLRLKGPVITSEDLGIYAILFDPKRKGDLEFHSRNILGPLLSNDAQGIYWETLEKFFENNCHLDATASSLNVHISTLRYRLDRIRTLFELDWQRSDKRLQLHIAIVAEQWRRSQGTL